jgi:hypothetical protein
MGALYQDRLADWPSVVHLLSGLWTSELQRCADRHTSTSVSNELLVPLIGRSHKSEGYIPHFTFVDSVVGIATGYGLDNRGVGVRVPIGSRIFSSPRRSDRLWGPPNHLSNGYRGLFPRGYNGRSVTLTTHLQLVPRSRKCESMHSLPHTPSWRST